MRRDNRKGRQYNCTACLIRGHASRTPIRSSGSVPFFAKISYLPPKIRLPSPVEVKNRMSMTTGTTYFIITL